MLASSLVAIFSLALASHVAGLNILLTNDDTWASANIRATYAALKADGHEVLMVAPALQQSGKGGTFTLPTNLTIPAPGGEFGIIPPGAPYYGHDANDKKIWYFNGSPAASAIFGLDVVAPQVYGANHTFDLVVSGPNEGQNAGPFLYTLSGTVGATYASVERGIPAIATSAGNSTHRAYTTNTGAKDDPANVVAKLVANFVAALAHNVNTDKERLLPLGVGLNINFPTFGPSSNCTAPPFTATRLTGGAIIDKLSIGPDGLPQYADVATDAVNVKYNGLTYLPGETPTAAQCKTAVSVFSVDYDAPTRVAAPVEARLKDIWGRTEIH